VSDPDYNWQDFVARIRSHGPLAKQLYVVLTQPANGLAPLLEHREAHLAYQEQLEGKGIMFGAGPFADDNEEFWEGHGMVIIRATSLAEAKKIADADPMHKSGARIYRIRPWLLNEGCLTIKVSYSNGKREII